LIDCQVPGAASSRGSNYEDTEDARSESGSLVHRLGLTKKKNKVKPAKVQLADFDELFARGMARSAQLESEGNVNPFGGAASPGKTKTKKILSNIKAALKIAPFLFYLISVTTV
jgi:hypothetical protein